MEKQLITLIQQALKTFDLPSAEIKLDRPSNLEFGDYTCAIALQLSRKLKKNPFELAQEIAKAIEKIAMINSVEAVKPGFINIKLSNDYLFSQITDFTSGKMNIPPVHFGKEKKVMVEYAHPNTHKLFHIGHMRNISTGESVARILTATGNKVIRTNYQGDVGMHIAKCLWRLSKMIEESGKDILKIDSLYEKIKFLGLAYSEGNKAFETDETAKQEIIDVNKKIYGQDPEITQLWKETRQWSLDYFDEIYKRVYTKYDKFYFESESPTKAQEIVADALKKGILEKSEGAVVFKGEQYGLDTRVFLNALGLPTYEGKELALAEREFSDFGELDKAIHVVGPEQVSFFNVTFKVEELLNPKKFKDKQYHLVYGWVDLKEGKMSSRSGNVVEGPWLIDEAKKRILETFKIDEPTAETLAVAAVKYSFLKNTTNANMSFHFQESISLEGNSAPYLLYTYVRTQSVLKKTEMKKTTPFSSLEPEERQLLQTLYQYPGIVEQAALHLSPNGVANYLFDLAQKYNLFYQKHQILKADEDIKQTRLLLTKSVSEVLKHGLNLLGIETVEKM